MRSFAAVILVEESSQSRIYNWLAEDRKTVVSRNDEDEKCNSYKLNTIDEWAKASEWGRWRLNLPYDIPLLVLMKHVPTTENEMSVTRDG